MLDTKTITGTGRLYRFVVPGGPSYQRRFESEKAAIEDMKQYIPMKRGWTIGIVTERQPGGKQRWLLTRFNSKGTRQAPTYVIYRNPDVNA